jgi:hypothetical protein
LQNLFDFVCAPSFALFAASSLLTFLIGDTTRAAASDSGTLLDTQTVRRVFATAFLAMRNGSVVELTTTVPTSRKSCTNPATGLVGEKVCSDVV